MKMSYSLYLMAITLMLGAMAGRAQDCVFYEAYPRLIGITEADLTSNPICVDKSGDILLAGQLSYSADRGTLRFFDVSDPAAPVALGEVGEATTLCPWHVEARGDLAYACFNDMGLNAPKLFVIDFSDPSAPEDIGVVSLPAHPRDLTVVGDYVYIALNDEGVGIIDVSDPTSPALLATTGFDQGYVQDLDYKDGHVLAGAGTMYLMTVESYDVSDPAAPVHVATVSLGAHPEGLVLIGDHLYVGTGNDPMHVVDVSDPAAPFLVAEVELPSSARYMTWEGSMIYYGTNSSTRPIVAVDVSDPINPVALGIFPTPGEVNALCADGGMLYAQLYNKGFAVIDAGNNMTVPRAFETELPYTSRTIQIVDDTLWSTVDFGDDMDPEGYLEIYSLANPTNPIQVNSVALPYRGGYASFYGDYAYLNQSKFSYSGYLYYLGIYDATDPAAPVELATIDFHYHRGVRIGRDMMFVVVSDGIKLYSLADPLAPAEVGFIGESNGFTDPRGAFWRDDLLFINDNDLGIDILDVSDPFAPVLLSEVSPPHFGGSWAIIEDRLYSVGEDQGMSIVNIADPGAPYVVGGSESIPWVSKISKIGDRLYCALHPVGLQVIDISDPATPRIAGNLAPETRPRWIFTEARGDFLYGVTTEAMLVLYRDCNGATATEDQAPQRPGPELDVWPNPFNPGTNISFSLKEAATVSLAIHDVAGRRLAELARGDLSAGDHVLFWDGKEAEGRMQASGLYFARLVAGDQSAVRKLVLLK